MEPEFSLAMPPMKPPTSFLFFETTALELQSTMAPLFTAATLPASFPFPIINESFTTQDAIVPLFKPAMPPRFDAEIVSLAMEVPVLL